MIGKVVGATGEVRFGGGVQFVGAAQLATSSS